jgi:molybdopterin-guanine dinucleotide biosynthesis protein A
MQQKELIGIVACGGNSSRMGRDKSLLTYYELPQRYHVYEMLQEICASAYISCNKEQARTIRKGYDTIIDGPEFENLGPLTALLTAFHQYPGKDILLIGCDYPYLTKSELRDFILHCRSKEKSGAFYDPEAATFISVLGLYLSGSETELFKQAHDRGFSLRKFLQQQQATPYIPKDLRSMISVDTPAVFERLKNLR